MVTKKHLGKHVNQLGKEGLLNTHTNKNGGNLVAKEIHLQNKTKEKRKVKSVRRGAKSWLYRSEVSGFKPMTCRKIGLEVLD